MPDMVSIHLRPPVVVNRLMHGGWVGDFNKGAGNNSAVAALAIAHQPLGAATVDGGRHGSLSAEGFSAKLKSIAEPMRRSCNYDQGTEMSWHKKLSGAMGVKVYFFDPHSP
jgi:IS30 family transposase